MIYLSRLKDLAARREMRVFWIALPFLFAVLILNTLYLSPPFNFICSALILLIGAFACISSLAAARANLDVTTERNEMKSIVGGLSDALIVYDQNFRISFFNAGAEALFSVQAKDILGRPIRPQDVEQPETRLLAQVIYPSLAPSLVSRSKAGAYPQVSDISFTDPELELRVTTVPVTGDSGEVRGFMKLIRNRTHEITLIRSKEEFITVASHQLRTPITELTWALEAVKGDSGLKPESQSLIEHAHESAKKLLGLVEDLLAISKIEEGRFGYSFAATDLVTYLEANLKGFLAQAEHAGVKLYFDRPSDALPQVMIDPAKLNIVLSNLIDNAIRYNVPNGQIIVGVKKMENGPFLEIFVKDTGIGIPPEEMKSLFGKFYRATNALKFQTEGSGLGLYIARNIIQAHGGQMSGESELDRGSTFRFTLPTDFTLVPTKEVALE